jgi:hypothetical protein
MFIFLLPGTGTSNIDGIHFYIAERLTEEKNKNRGDGLTFGPSPQPSPKREREISGTNR